MQPKTNNRVEGYHGQLSSYSSTHPNLWSWIKYIQQTEESGMLRLEQEQSTRSKRLTSVNNDNIC
jgi:hypothetical protein